MTYDEEPLPDNYAESELEKEFHRVMDSDVVARHGYNTADSYRLDKEWRLKAAVVALSNAYRQLMDEKIEAAARSVATETKTTFDELWEQARKHGKETT